MMNNDDTKTVLEVLMIILIILLAAFAFSMFPVVNYWGTWLMSSPSICFDKVSDTGASAKGMAIECGNRAHAMTIEHVNSTAVTVCRCVR